MPWVTVNTSQNAGWVNIELDQPVVIIDGTYYSSVETPDGFNLYYETVASTTAYYFARAYNCGANITPEEGSLFANHRWAIIFNNNSGDPI